MESIMRKLKVENIEEEEKGGRERKRMVKDIGRKEIEWEERLKRLERRK